MASVTAGEAIGAGTRMVGPALRQAPAALGLLALTYILTTLAPGAEQPMNSLILNLIRLPFAALATAALLRMALGGSVAGDSGGYGPGGLQWGHLEWRVIAAQVLVGLIYAAVFIVFTIIAALILGILASAKVLPDLPAGASPTTPQEALALFTGPLGLALLVISIPALALFIYLALKLSLATTASASEGKIKVLSTWGLTRGVLWPIFAVSLVTFLVAFGGALVGVVLGSIGTLALGPAGAGLPAALGTGIGTALSLPVQIGGLAHIYLAQSGGRTNVGDVFR